MTFGNRFNFEEVKRSLWWWFWCILLVAARAQTPSDRFQLVRMPPADTLRLPHAPVVASRTTVLNLPATDYRLVSEKGWIIFQKKPEDSVIVRYMPYPFNLNEAVRDTAWRFLQEKDTLPTWEKERRLMEVAPAPVAEPWLGDRNTLQRSGSLTRGIAFGNARDATFQSAFNLQLSGDIGEGITISAAITDENIPVQPDGNTLQLQDFDKVYVTLRKGATQLTAGDYQLQKPDGYFLSINKRAQGLMLETSVDNGLLLKGLPKGKWTTRNAGAVARGKFKRQEFNGMEGNQGPYRLTGLQNESFILILSGSEAVYIDGVKLKRGLEHDYVIDYNTSEITFTTRRMITKDSRIVVEFEYSDRNYQRWMLFTGNRWDIGKVHVRMNFFTEFDDQNTPIFQTLSDSDRVILAAAGDQVQLAATSGAELVGYSTEEVRYRKTDTLVQGQVVPVFVYSTAPNLAVWRVRFTFVGQGNGDYVTDANAANGRVYRWVPPQPNGQSSGDYAPILRLVPPQSQHMLTLGSGGRLTKTMQFDVEGALSHLDRNRFSSLDGADNQDYGFMAKLTDRRPLRKRDKDTLLLISSLRYEQVGRNFQSFIRFRSVEFDRDWNQVNRNNPNEVLNAQLTGTDYIAGFSTELQQQRWGKLSYQLEQYWKGRLFAGHRHAVHFRWKSRGWALDQQASLTQTEDTARNTLFLRHRLSLSKKLRNWQWELKANDEINTQDQRNTGRILRSAYAFHEYETSLGLADSTKRQWRLFYMFRWDRMADSLQLRTGALAHHAGFQGRIQPGKDQRLSWQITYRQLDIPDTGLTRLQPEQTLLTRTDYSGKFFKQTLTFDVFYETGAGLENRRVYQFIPALNGLGDFIWVDYNGNSLKERDEFELRSGSMIGSDGNTYIKVFIPGNDYVKTYFNRLTANIQWRAPGSWKQSERGWKRFVYKWSMQTSWRSDRRTQDAAASFSPLPGQGNDTGLVAQNLQFRQSVYFNRFGGKIGIEYSFQALDNTSLIAGGAESRSSSFHLLRSRLQLADVWSWQNELRYGGRSSRAELLRSREFNLEIWEIHPKLVWQPNTRFRITAGYKGSWKFNRSFQSGGQTVMAGETSVMHRPGLEWKWNDPGKGSVEVRADYVFASFNGGGTSTPVAFEMLESLGQGHNVTWGAVIQRSLGQNLQLSITYDGRKTETGPVIHLGGAQLRAFF